MPFTTFQGENTVDELVDRLFNRLTDNQRKTAVRALVRANPKLKDTARLAPGTMLVVPNRAAPRAKVSRRLEDPDAVLLERIEAALREYEKDFEARSEERTKALEEAIFQAEESRVFDAVAGNTSLEKLAEAAMDEMKVEHERALVARERFKARVTAARNDIKARL